MKTVTLQIEIDTGNDAFQDDPDTATSDIISAIGYKIALGFNGRSPIRDDNGNHIGYWSFNVTDDGKA